MSTYGSRILSVMLVHLRGSLVVLPAHRARSSLLTVMTLYKSLTCILTNVSNANAAEAAEAAADDNDGDDDDDDDEVHW